MENENDKLLREKIEKVLETVRPYLQMDEGDVELVNIKDDIVEVRLLGSCLGCPMSQMTLRAGIERAILKYVPQIKRIEEVK